MAQATTFTEGRALATRFVEIAETIAGADETTPPAAPTTEDAAAERTCVV
jgi:hypothetical protein